MKTTLDYALAYAKLGWAILPVWSTNDHGHCRCLQGAKCSTPGKHPHSKFAPHGHLDATTDDATIRSWFEADPDAGIAITCDRSGLLVLDIDPRNGGLETLAKIEAEDGPLASTCVAISQGGGEHRFFKADSTLSYPATLGPGLDLKYHGYVCVEPTKGPDGVYRWMIGHSPLDGAPPSELPECIVSLCRPAERHERSNDHSYPVATAQTFNDLRDALRYINADDYQTWVNVGLALRPYGEAGYGIWTAWSSTSMKFDESEQRRKWDRDIDRPHSITYLSIFGMARDAGWQGNFPVTKLANTVDDDQNLDPENLFESIEPTDFDPDACLPPVLATWVKAHAQSSGLDAVGYAFSALAVMAAATNRTVRINLGSGHNVPVIIWAAIVGATGSGKSPAMNAAHSPLSAMNGLEVQHTQEAINHWKRLPKVERSSSPPEMRRVRYSADTTTEALAANLAKSDGPRILVHYDEGSGWLNNMGRYSSGGGGDGDRATYLSSWLGLRNHMINRVGRGVTHVPELGVCILFGITPNKIREGQKEATAEGLLGRTLLCFIKRRSHQVKAVEPDESALRKLCKSPAPVCQP